MTEEVFSESLAYNDVKRRAVASRSFRTKLPSSNSTSFTQNQTIVIRLPGNLQGQYYDFSQMYLKLKVTPNADCVLDRNGAYNFIQRVQISQAGAQICDINNYNVLVCAMLDHQSSQGWKASAGAQLIGCQGDALRGQGLVAADGARTFCLPMVCMPLANTTPHRLIPAFSLSDIEMRFTLNSNVAAVFTAATLAYTEVEMVCVMTELSPGAQAQVDMNTGGIYNILANSFMNSQATRALNATNVTANLGFSISSLERILVINRPTTSIGSATHYEQNRCSMGLTQYSFLINSEIYPQRPVDVADYGAEAFAELLQSDHALVDFSRSSSINSGFGLAGAANSHYGLGLSDLSGINPAQAKAQPYIIPYPTGTTAGAAGAVGADATPSDIGTFLVGCDFESAVATGKSHRIYSGISTLASNVQFRGSFNQVAIQSTMDFFAVFTIRILLNTRGLGVFEVSV